MENSRYFACLEADYARLAAVARPALEKDVPSCPGWTVAELVRHVGQVYLHKVGAMRDGAEPEGWPPEGTLHEEPLALLARAYAELIHEFDSRQPTDTAGSWYAADQTVGFWIRRMAQETVVHRIDAELGAEQAIAPVPDDLAVDGIDELLKVFAAYSVVTWPNAFTEVLGASNGWTYAIRTNDAQWSVRTAPGQFTVDDVAGASDVTISGPPTGVLRWVWNRDVAGAPTGVTIEGPPEAVAQLKRVITIATQ